MADARPSALLGTQKLLAFRPERPIFLILAHANGLVAQLEERLNGIEEVVSSILIGSTTLPIESGSTPKFWEGVWISRGLVKPVRLAAPQIGMERFRRDTPPGQCNIASGVRMGL